MRILHYPIPSIEHDLQDFHPVLQRIFLARGIQSSQGLDYELKKLLPYEGLLNIEEATQLLVRALKHKKNILIIGDYDVDGATSTVLACRALRAMGASSVHYLVPDRFRFGYGLSTDIVQVARNHHPDLIITVDNGISSHEGVNLARSLGIEVLITDHHIAGDSLPIADAIVNPNQPGDTFLSKNMAGVGVIFYVMLALRAALRKTDWFASNQIEAPNMANFLDLVALGTVADVVTLDHNNRILVEQGLRRIRGGHCVPGIQSLLKIAKRSLSEVSAADLAFAVGPRLNAAGRLEDMSVGIQCLLSDKLDEAQALAIELNVLNDERKGIEEEMRQMAFHQLAQLPIDEKKLPAGIVLYDEQWHQGVIGILASRIKEKYHRPSIVFASADAQTLKGSARSLKGFHMRDALDAIAKKHPRLISKFGGHAMAAGLTIAKKDFNDFSKAFDEKVQAHLSPEDLLAFVYTDGALSTSDLTVDFARLLKNQGPWGQGFPEPLFDDVFKIVDQRLVGEKHLKCILQKDDLMIDAIAFFIDTQEWPDYRCEHVKITYTPEINEFQERCLLQLNIRYLEKKYDGP